MGEYKYYMNTNTKTYYHFGNVNCDKCSVLQKERFILNIQWFENKPAILKHVCFNCITALRKLGDTDQNIMFYITQNIGNNLSPFLIEPPELCYSSGMNVFQSALVKSEAKIIDHCKYSGKEGYTFGISDKEKRTVIGISELQDEHIQLETKQRIEELDSPVMDIYGFLKEKENNITIPFLNEDRKRLENNDKKLLE